MMLAAVLLVVVVVASPGVGRAADAAPDAHLALDAVQHALEGSTLVITGWVHNRGPAAVSRLVVDATGFSPAGDLMAFGSDGIPWQFRPGTSERFAVRLPVLPALVRDYVVQVSMAGASRPLAGVRRSVDIELYRPLLFTLIQVEGDVHAGVLTVRSRTAGLPVARVTAEAAVIVVQPEFNSLEHLTLDVPAGRAVTVVVGGRQAFLVNLRLVDILLNTSWEQPPATVMLGDVTLFLHRRSQHREPGWPLRDEDHVAFAVEDVDRACAELKSAGLAVEIEPRDFYWGRSAYLRDPDGHLVELHQA